jgi:lipopolysaccharide/colanic/teichoic acid biosynthesis glycosyltransferase
MGLRANSGERATSRGASRSYAARRRVKPGITRWAQINGLRGDLGPVGKLKQRVEHDIKDIENKDIEK